MDLRLRVGDVVLCEDFNEPGRAAYGTVVPPLDKHEVRQCKTTDLVVIELATGLRRISNGEEVIRRFTVAPVVS